MKKINKYLLENYPLIWNTKIVLMVLILLGAHIAFYAAGFLSFSNPKDLNTYSLFDNYFRNGALWIGILFSILTFILWLKSYFKQNAFKSFYPKTNRSLFMEFVWIFIICFMNISFYLSYTEGLRQSVSNSITMEELEREADIANKGEAFTLYSTYRYNERCVPAPVFDSLVSEEEVLRLYVENQVKNSYSSDWQNVNPANYLRYEDRLPQPYYRNDEFITLLAAHFPERVQQNREIARERPSTMKAQNDEVVLLEYESYYNNANEGLRSLYSYCGRAVYFQSEKGEKYYAQHRADLLQYERKAEIEKLLNDYLVLADKYEISYRFKDARWIDYVYNPPYYFVDYDLSREQKYDNYNDRYIDIDHVRGDDLTRSIGNLIQSKSNVISIESVAVLLYLALFFAILIFTFRMTSMRIWLMSSAGAIIVMFIYGALTAFGFVIARGDSEVWMINQPLLFILAFWAILIYCLKKRKRKKMAGMFLNFCIVTLPAIFPLLTAIYANYLDKYSGYKYSELAYHHPHYELISQNVRELFLVNVGVSILLLFLIIPLIKKWKSLPEE